MTTATNPKIRTILSLLLMTIITSSLSGCTAFNLKKWNRKPIPKADAKNPAVEILAIWQPAEGRGANGVPTRGFAGQILFFTREHSSPVEVDGDVRVYLFDDRGTVAEQSKPIHQFDFLADAWKSHLQMSALGPSYQVFIPYVRNDHYQARCALRIRLTPKETTAIYSETANIVLPGPQLESTLADQKGSHSSDEAKSEETESEGEFDRVAARKIIAERLHKVASKNGGTLSGEVRRDRLPAARQHSMNSPVARLEYASEKNRVRYVPVSAESMPDGDDDFDPLLAGASYDDNGHPLLDSRDAAPPTVRLRLTPAQGNAIRQEPQSGAIRQVGWTDEDDPEEESFSPVPQNRRHPLADDGY